MSGARVEKAAAKVAVSAEEGERAQTRGAASGTRPATDEDANVTRRPFPKQQQQQQPQQQHHHQQQQPHHGGQETLLN